jgi:hypothetical protein
MNPNVTADITANTDTNATAFTHVYHIGPKEGRQCWFMTVPGDCATFYATRGYRAIVSNCPREPFFYYPPETDW